MWSIEENLQCAPRSDSEEDEQLKTIDDRGNVFPIISNLEERHVRWLLFVILALAVNTYFFVMAC
jgi:hypothetical protein